MKTANQLIKNNYNEKNICIEAKSNATVIKLRNVYSSKSIFSLKPDNENLEEKETIILGKRHSSIKIPSTKMIERHYDLIGIED